MSVDDIGCRNRPRVAAATWRDGPAPADAGSGRTSRAPASRWRHPIAHLALWGSAACGPGDYSQGSEETEADELQQCRAQCSDDAACGYHHACVEGLCRFAACGDLFECLEGQVCAADEVVGLAICVDACATAADCGSGQPPYESINYECIAGGCHFTGCTSDLECGEGNACVAQASGVSVCRLRCEQAADCTLTTGSNLGAWDEDNHACLEGTCHWLGCRSSSECDPGNTCA